MSRELKKVLYVEDEPDILEIALMSLESIGKFEAVGCEDGHTALKRIPEFEPDLVILDMMMPGMDGLATLGEIRKLPMGETLPVVFMTAKVQSHELDEYKEMGALGIISKPFDPMTLPDQLRELWNNNQ